MKIVRVEGEDAFTFKIIRDRMYDLLEGEVIENFSITQDSYTLIQRNLASLGQESISCAIEFDKRWGRIRIYGLLEKRKTLKDKVTEVHKTIFVGKQIAIHLRGNGKRPGLMKELMRKYGPRLHDLMPSKDCGIIQVIKQMHSFNNVTHSLMECFLFQWALFRNRYEISNNLFLNNF